MDETGISHISETDIRISIIFRPGELGSDHSNSLLVIGIGPIWP